MVLFITIINRMGKNNPNKRERYIILYSDEFSNDIWEEYCDALGISPIETEVRINFDYSDVVAKSEMSISSTM